MLTELRVMRGPNMWSTKHHQLLVIKFDVDFFHSLGEESRLKIKQHYENTYGNSILSGKNFEESLFQHLLKIVAFLQGDHLFHELHHQRPKIFYGVVEYKVEQAGQHAVELAFAEIKSVLENITVLSPQEMRSQVTATAFRYSDGPTTSLIVNAAKKKNIPVTDGPAGYKILGYGKNQKKISAALSHQTSCIAVNIAGNKEHTKQFLESANIPVPQGHITSYQDDLEKIAAKLGYPLVTKPFNGNQGRNVTCGISNFEELLNGFLHAKEISRSVIIEKQIVGNDFRLLVIGGKFTAAALRLPASVTGDGIHTIQELVELENQNPQRGNGHENVLTKISLDSATELYLLQQGLTLESVPEVNQQLFLKSTANLSTGGTAEDVTDLIHPENRKLAEKVARVIGLDICGIDVVSSDISVPLTENNAAVIEVNAAPGLRMHAFPSKGNSREVGKPIVDLMFKNDKNGRIPIVAITGTNGKTTTTRLMAHVASFSGFTVGFSSTDGIFIDKEKIKHGDCSGPQSAKTILHDSLVDFAVLECARGGIIRSGLGFDQCDIAIVTNVAADHLGLKDIYTLEDLAVVKSVVPQSVKPDGWAILNANDELVVQMKNSLQCNVAFFSSNEENSHLQEHINNDGIAIFSDNNKDIFIVKNREKQFILNAAEIPITRNGKADFMVENVLPVILASYLSKIKTETICQALTEFIPTADHTPGRISDFLINGVNVIVDYAHNPHGLRALSNYLKNIPEKKTGIITGTGDRREEDIMEFGRIAASTYDEIIIRFDRNLRGRSKESIVELLTKGFHEVNPSQKFQIIPDTQTAIHHAVETAEKGSYVVVCADDANYTVGLTKKVAEHFKI